MSGELVQYNISDIEKMGNAIAKSKLFGVSTPEQAIALMLVAQAEGRHPALAAKDYHVIQNKPSKTADAMLRDFLASGGRVEWHTLTDTKADATFSHPQGGSVKIDWDMDRAKKAGLNGKEMWNKYPRQMLRARCVSEGIRTVCPDATSGFYVPEEVQDFDEKPMKNITPEAVKEVFDSVHKPITEIESDLVIEGIKERGSEAAQKGTAALQEWWKNLAPEYQNKLTAEKEEWKKVAKERETPHEPI
jgi:hypothetical protein